MAQSLSNVPLHIIFSTKNRVPFIDKTIMPELYAYITSISTANGSYIHNIGGIDDHIHVLATLPRVLTMCGLVQELKQHSSKWIKSKDQKYKGFAWQKGYGAFAVSESLIPTVSKYISNQKEHHQSLTFQDEYRKI